MSRAEPKNESINLGGRVPDINEQRLQRVAIARLLNFTKSRTATFVEISRPTLDAWIENGHRLKELVEAGEEGLLSEREKHYLQFAYVWEGGRDQIIGVCVAGLLKHGKKNPQPYEWLLEKLDPEVWGKFEARAVPLKKEKTEGEGMISDEHKELDPYEPERAARLILSFKEAGLVPQEVIDAIIDGGDDGGGSALSEDAPDEVSSGNGKS